MSDETTRWLLLGASLAFTILVWFRLIGLKEHLGLKVLIAVVALIPVIGPIVGLWITGMPDVQPRKFWATMNHWGKGGRFIGFGSGRFTYGDLSDQGKDWNPTVPERIRQQKKSKKNENT